MNKYIVFLSFLFICAFGYCFITDNDLNFSSDSSIEIVTDSIPTVEKLYKEMQLEGVVRFEAFSQAFTGYEELKPEKSILTVIDFSLPSTEKRLFVLDLKQREVLFSSLVAHGRKSGENFATSFSNKIGSHKSSLGFYITENTYIGSNGYSLVINGLEYGINDKAKERAVVIHAADYCSMSMIKSSGRLGRSFGCPALPAELNKPIIDCIKNGSLIYIYADDDNYQKRSPILAKSNKEPKQSDKI